MQGEQQNIAVNNYICDYFNKVNKRVTVMFI